MRKFFQLLFIAIITIISSCKKNEVTAIPDPITPFDNRKTITTVVAGKVTAQDGTVLTNVEITIGTSKTITDANGNFIIPKATLSEKVGFIKASKTGYFGGSRTIIAKEKVVNNVLIQLVKKTISGDFINATGGLVSVSAGGSILFPANAVVTKSGSAYVGSVYVSAYSLDPTISNCYKEMPGDLRGINDNNNEQFLTSYGMMAVELNGSNGEALQLATGKNATITFPIAATLQSAAPTTIPLWFFDETKGMWVEQGSATKTGNNYVGTVSHFTWWNFDYGAATVSLSLKIKDQNGNPISNATIKLTKDVSVSVGTGSNSATANTNSDGSFIKRIPYNEPLTMSVFIGKSACSVLSAPIKIEPQTKDADLGTIIINISNLTQRNTRITGIVNDCTDNPVANGYAIINIGGQVFYQNIENGILNFSEIYCSNVIAGVANVEVVDLASLKKNTTPIKFNITGSGVYNIGKTTICGMQTAIHYNESFADLNGLPLSKYYVTFTGITNVTYLPNSTIDVILPLNTVFTRKVYAAINTCSNYKLIDSAVIGEFTADFNAGLKLVDISQPNSVVISGFVTNCNNQPVASGYATIKMDGSVYVSNIINGNFSQSLVLCNNTTAVVEVVDNNGQQKNSLITSVNNNLNLNTIQACGISTSEFLTYQYDTLNRNNYDSLIVKTSGGVSFSGYTFTPYNYFKGNFTATNTGTYPLVIQFADSSVLFNSLPANPGSVTITEFGSVGQYIGGNFTSTVKDALYSQMHQVSGSFRIMRTQ